MDASQLGRILVVLGAVTLGIGLLLIAGDRIPFFGRLPGDIVLHRNGTIVFVPLASMVLLSVLLTIVVNVVIWLSNR
jgi:hypothetical protein